MITAEVDQAQLAALMQRLGGLAARVRDREPINRRVAVELYGFVARNFQTEGGLNEGGPWAPLADSTVAWKEARGYSMVLQNTGELRESFQMMSGRDYAGVGAQRLAPVYRPNPPRGSRGEAGAASRSPDLAATHEFGTDRVPARPMLPSQAQALEIGMQIYDAWIKESL